MKEKLNNIQFIEYNNNYKTNFNIRLIINKNKY